MSGDETTRAERRLADAMAAFDDRLAVGRETPTDELGKSVDPDLLPEWERLAAFLTLVEHAWPRGASHLDCRTEPAPTGPVETQADADGGPPEVGGPAQFGRFRIRKTLGQGGFGIVFLAWDPALRRQVALKVPQPETLVTPEARKRFLREAHAAAGLDHPNIVPVYESGSVDTITYIASAYCPGPTLAGWLVSQSQPVRPRDVAHLGATLARAIHHAHGRGVLHRDLKPSNVLLQRPGAVEGDAEGDHLLSEFQPRITDFSLAWLADGDGPKTRSGVPIGSPPYMAPEQAEGRLKAIGPPTDVYGLGCILYELLTCRPPFGGESQLDTLKQVTASDPIPPRRMRKDLSVALEAITLKCLEKDPTRRYPSGCDLADDLDRFLAGEPTRARPPSRWEKIRRAAKRHPASAAVLTLGLLFAGTLLGGRRWFEDRLRETRHAAGRLENEVRDRRLAARRTQYIADIRQVPRYIQDNRASLADEVLLRHRPRPGEDDLRGFAWYYLRKRSHTERRTLAGHRGDVYYVEFSPRGNLLASAGKDGTVLIWDTSHWQLVRKIVAAQTEVNAAAFSPDGETIATVDDDGTLKLWEIATGHCQLERHAHNGDAVVARFTGDGNKIITGGRTDGLVKTWDRKTGVMLDSFRPGEPNLENFIFSPDGSCQATVGGVGAKLWKWPGRALIVALSGSEGAQGAAFYRDGTRLATAHETDQALRLWDVPGGRLVRKFRGHTEGVYSVCFSADGRTILSASRDETIRLWNVATGKERGVHLGHSGRVWNLAVSPDGHTIASAGQDGTVKLWDPEPPRDGSTLPIPVPGDLEFSTDGRTLLVLEFGPQWSLSRWDVHSGSLLDRKPLNLTGSNWMSAFSHDGRLLAIANESDTITLCDLDTGHRQRLHDRAIGEVISLKFSFDNRFLLLHTARPKPGYLLWSLASQRVIPFPKWDAPLDSCWTPLQEVLTPLHGGDLGWWNPTTGLTKRFPLDLHYKHIAVPTVSTDGRFLAAVDADRHTICLRSTETMNVVKEFAPYRGGLYILVFSPDGNTLASACDDQTVKLWDVPTGEDLLTLGGFGGSTWTVRFSPNGKALATISATGPNKPGEVRVWLAAGAEPEEGP
jgi:eukaryotic-like serine/threonine-protein kinase